VCGGFLFAAGAMFGFSFALWHGTVIVLSRLRHLGVLPLGVLKKSDYSGWMRFSLFRCDFLAIFVEMWCFLLFLHLWVFVILDFGGLFF
jgi:hypothetical protein